MPAKGKTGGYFGKAGETYIYINGIRVRRNLDLGNGIALLPAHCQPNRESIFSVFESEVEVGAAALFLRSISSQLQITESVPIAMAARAWNAAWDVLLLGALCDCEVAWNFQSDRPAEEFGPKSRVQITNFHLRGMVSEPFEISEDQCVWIENHIGDARTLMDNPAFRNAVHCMATYRWHSMPRARIALIWAGIEGLFGIESELRFRLSQFAARFLEPGDANAAKKLFVKIQKIYSSRSKAVHGSKMKEDTAEVARESAELLLALVRRCIEINGLPDKDLLAP